MATVRTGLGSFRPPERVRRGVGFVLLLLTTATILTNAYYLRFLEPSVSRGALALTLIGATILWFLVAHVGLPANRHELSSLVPRARTPLLLALILAGAVWLRYPGLESGLPQSYVPDEYDYVHSYLQMIKRGDLNPRWWHHPSVQPYVNVVTYLAVFYLEAPKGRWRDVNQMQVEDMLFWGRFGAGFVPGVLTVLVVFFLGRRVFSEGAGLVGAAVAAAAPGLVEISQYNKPDALLALFCTASVLVTLTYLDRGGGRLAFAAGAVVGFAVAVKYNAALVLLPLLLAVAFRNGLRFLARPDVYLGLGGAVIGFTAGCPYFFADLERFLNHVAAGLYNYGFVGLEGAQGTDNWYGHAVYTIRYGAGILPFLASLAGLTLALYRIDRRIAVFLLYPVLYYGFYGSQKINFAGNLMPVYPFFAILAGLSVTEAASGIGRALSRRSRLLPGAGAQRLAEALVVGGAVIALLWFPASLSAHRNRLITLPDTGSLAARWIESRFPPNTHFAVERHTPVLDPSRYPITRESRVINQSVGHYREAGVEYLITSSTVYDRFHPDHRQSRRYRRLFETCPLVKEFAPEEGRIMGPTMRILRVPAEETSS